MINQADLKSEIENDPVTLGYSTHLETGNDSEIANLLNAKSYTIVQPIPKASLLIWAAATGIRSKIENHITDANVGSICLSVRDMLVGSSSDTLDMTNPMIAGQGGMLDILSIPSIGVLNASGPGSKADLINLATVPASRADTLFGFGTIVSHIDVAQALRS